jgi:hypothetical protein
MLAMNGMGTVARSRAAEHSLTHSESPSIPRIPKLSASEPKRGGVRGHGMCVRYGTVQCSMESGLEAFSICISVELDEGGEDKRREWQPMGDRTLSSEPHEIHVLQR